MGGNTMRAALYFPHTKVQSEQLVRSSLLLWDTVECIVPDPRYKPGYPDKKIARAMEIIGKLHCPDDSEKREAHQFVEEFATRPLPEAFYYEKLNGGGEDYEIWPQKFLDETWCLLQNLKLTGDPLRNADYPTNPAVGLSLMSILAECCAGETRARITDQGPAYAMISNMLVEDPKQDESASYEYLVPLTLKLLDISNIPIDKLIAFREREKKESNGYTLTGLRHNYLKSIEAFAGDMSKLTRKRDRDERSRTFESDMRSDLKQLSQEVWGARVDVIFSKEAVASVLLAVTTAVGAIHGVPLAIPTVAAIGGGVVTVGGGVLVGNKYAASRRAILQKHPMAYLYELRRA
jgi:hypothetical protein